MKMNKIKFLFFFFLAYTCATAQPPQKSGNTPSFTAPISNSPITNNTGDNPIFNINYTDSKLLEKLLNLFQTLNQNIDHWGTSLPDVMKNQTPPQINLNINNINHSEINNNNYPDNYYEDGIMYLNKNEYEKAIVFLKHFTELYYKQYPDTLLQKEKDANYYIGIAYFYKVEYENAIDFLENTNLYKTSENACYYIGLAYECIGHKMQEYEKAMKYYDTAIGWYDYPYQNGFGNNHFCYLQKGMSLLRYKKDSIEAAIKIFENIIDWVPNCIEAYCCLGDAYSYIQQPDSAIKWYNKAIDIDRNYAYAYNRIGDVYNYFIHDYDSAICYYNKVVDLFNNHIKYTARVEPNGTKTLYPSPNYYEIGNAYFFKEDYDRAIEYYNRAIELYPNSLYYYNGNMGDAYYNKPDYEKAISYYQKAADSAPDCYNCLAFTYSKIGDTYLQQQNEVEGIEYVKKALYYLDPNNDRIYNVKLGFISLFKNYPDYISPNFYEDAIKYFEKALLPQNDENAKFLNTLMYWIIGTIYLELEERTSEEKYRINGIENFQKAANLESEKAQQWLKDNNIIRSEKVQQWLKDKNIILKVETQK